MVLDHRSTPIASFDAVRKTFTRHRGTARSLAEISEGQAPFNRILAQKERFLTTEQRVLRHKVFAKPAFAGKGGSYQQLTPISGIRRAEGTVCVLGMLTQPHAGRFFLEDGSHSVELDLTNAKSTQGLFTGQCHPPSMFTFPLYWTNTVRTAATVLGTILMEEIPRRNITGAILRPLLSTNNHMYCCRGIARSVR